MTLGKSTRRKAFVLILLAAGLAVASCGLSQPTALPPTTSPPQPTSPPAPTPAPTSPPTATPTPEGLAVPLAPAPTIDGVLAPGEWDNALRARFSDGSTLLFMQDGTYLYLGVRAPVSAVGVVSVCLDRGQEVAVLHSSAALGTAIYEPSGEQWNPTRTFSWECRETDDGPAARRARQSFLEHEGWLANNGNTGTPGQIEFQIAMPAGTLRMAVAYVGPLSEYAPTYWPAGMGDDCRAAELVRGDTPTDLRFRPEGWMTVVADPTPIQVERLDFRTSDGITLTGRLFRHTEAGDAVVLLAHMGGRDQRDWEDFARLMASRGLPAFTLDMRCHGESGCDASSDIAHRTDLRAALALLRERGYRRVVCVGASLGAGACARVALVEELAGLVFLGGPNPGVVGDKQYPQDLVNPGMPKLFVVTEYDRYAAVRTATRELYEVSPEPRHLQIYPGTAHGTEMLTAEYGDDFRDLLANFLEEALR